MAAIADPPGKTVADEAQKAAAPAVPTYTAPVQNNTIYERTKN